MTLSGTDYSDPLEELVHDHIAHLYGYHGKMTVQRIGHAPHNVFLLNMCRTKRIMKVLSTQQYTPSQMKAEALWMEQLKRSATLNLPKVIAGLDGEPVQQLILPDNSETYNCVMYSYLLGNAGKKLQGNDLLKKMIALGRITAALHNYVVIHNIHTDRPEWNFDTLLGKNSRKGNWRDFPGLDSENKTVVQSACDRIQKRVTAYGRGFDRFGLIHADLQFSNLIIRGNSLQVVDFDDCGYGWFLYDLGSSLCAFDTLHNELTQAWLTGYRDIRNISQEDIAEIPTFILMRRIVAMGEFAAGTLTGMPEDFLPEQFLSVTLSLCQAYLAEDHAASFVI